MEELRTAGRELVQEARRTITPIEIIRGRVRRRRRLRSTLGVGAIVGVLVAGGLAVRSSSDTEQVALDGPSAAQDGPVSLGDPNLPTGDLPAAPEDIAAEISTGVDLASLGSTPVVVGDHVEVAVRAGHDRVADALISRYGDRVVVVVDATQWPPSTGVPPEECVDRMPASEVQGVSAVLDVEETHVPFAEAVRGTVMVRNDTDAPIRVNTVDGEWVVGVLRAPSGELTGGVKRYQLLVASQVEIPAGAAQPIPVLITPGSCTLWNGSAVQPGQYDAIAIVRLSDGREAASTPAVVTVVDPPAQ